MPGYIDIRSQQYRPHPDLAIRKSEIRICPAWQIQEHDPDGVGIFDNDDPIIPADVSEPPVLKLLQRKRKNRERRS